MSEHANVLTPIPDELKLFYVQWENGDQNMDLLVQAFDYLQAAKLWRTHYYGDALEGIYDLEETVELSIREMILGSLPGSVSWDNKSFLVTIRSDEEPMFKPAPEIVQIAPR
jgi:hypothetical protein